MAQHEIGNPHGVLKINGTNRSGAKDDDNLDTIATMKARLQVIDAATYTDDRLNKMTYNDLVSAIRILDTPTEIKQ